MNQEQTYRLRDGKELLIRPARVEDAQAMQGYIHRVSGETDNLTFGPEEFSTTVDRQVEIIEQFQEPGKLFIVGLVDGELSSILSFVNGRKVRTAHAGEFGLTVQKKFWGLGIATKMMKYLLEWAEQSQLIRKIDLRVRTDNASAIAVYEKLGFKQEGLLTRHFLMDGKFYDCYQMGLWIDPKNEK
jgi:RimJ/RimL family protein N-acetyltransferase